MNHGGDELGDVMFVFSEWPALKHEVMGGPENAVEIGPDIGVVIVVISFQLSIRSRRSEVRPMDQGTYVERSERP
jgi:hypothetical protein